MLKKKTISPVVATALLLVVAVVAVVGFQTFFNTYSSGLFSKVETQSSNSVGSTQIENLIGSSLYFKNANTYNITITSVKINGVDCNYFANVSTGINEINVTNCVSNLTTQTPEVVIFTNTAIYSKNFYIKDIIVSTSSESSALNCSALGLNGGSWSTVPGNNALGTSDFCVMKFEAKNVASVVTSQGLASPWVNINQVNSRNNCTALGANYHLITNAEWTTIARNAEANAENWNSTVVGSGFMFSGHNDNSPASALVVTNESDYYNGTNDSISSPGDGIFTNFPSNDARAYMGQKRVLILNNSEVIWDLSGNVYEWNNDTCGQGDPWYSGAVWIEWSNSNVNSTEKNLGGPLGNYDSNSSVGRYYGCDAAGHSFLRSGDWSGGAYAGMYGLYFNSAPSATAPSFGFRCAYTP